MLRSQPWTLILIMLKLGPISLGVPQSSDVKRAFSSESGAVPRSADLSRKTGKSEQTGRPH